MLKNESINIITLFHKFYRYKWSVLFISVAILIATFFYIKQIIPIYSSNILISIQSDKSTNISLFQNDHIVNVDMKSKLEYDTKILKSRYIISKVLDKIDFSKRFFLHNKWRDIELYGQEIPFEVDFNTSSPNSSFQFILKTIDQDTFILKNIDDDDNKSLKYCKYGEIIKGDSYYLSINQKLNFSSDIEYRIDLKNNKNSMISDILNNLIIEKQANRLLKISYEDRVPNRAKDVISQLVKSYKEYNLNSRQLDDVNHIAFLDKAILEVGDSLKKISNKIKKYRTIHSELLSIDAENKIFSNIIEKNRNIEEISLKLNALKVTKSRFKKGIYSTLILENNSIKSKEIKESIDKLKIKRERLTLLKKQSNNLENLIINDSFYMNLVTQLKKDKMELTKLLVEYTEEYSKVRKIEKRINAFQQEMQNYIDNHININSKKIKELKIEIAKIIDMLIATVEKKYFSMKKSLKKDKKSIDSIPESTIKLKELKRAFELNENNYKRLLQKRSEALISKESTISNIQIVDSASEPIHPIKPKKAFLYLSGFILGLFLSIFYTSFRTLRDKTIYDENDILLDNYSLVYDKNQNREDIIWILLSQIEEKIGSKESKIVLISSSSYKENKKSIIKELSLALEEVRKRVLIIDFDLDNAQITKELDKSSEIGLSTILTSRHNLSEMSISDYINYINYDYKNIDILCSGPIVQNNSSLLFNPKVKVLLEELSKEYDYILIDSTPIGVKPTVNILFEYIDMLLIVAEIKKTNKDFFQKLNKVNKRNMDILLLLTNSI
jgi:uncharacterized protein involved in exopolysaccharide biosynthesis